jgi:hypothetical protein
MQFEAHPAGSAIREKQKRLGRLGDLAFFVFAKGMHRERVRMEKAAAMKATQGSFCRGKAATTADLAFSGPAVSRVGARRTEGEPSRVRHLQFTAISDNIRNGFFISYRTVTPSKTGFESRYNCFHTRIGNRDARLF